MAFLSVQIPEWQLYYFDLWAMHSLTLVSLNFLFYAGIAHLYQNLRNSCKIAGLKLAKVLCSAVSSSFCSVCHDSAVLSSQHKQHCFLCRWMSNMQMSTLNILKCIYYIALSTTVPTSCSPYKPPNPQFHGCILITLQSYSNHLRCL